MSPSTPTPEGAPLEPAPVSKGGTYTIQAVSVGCKLYITRPGPDGTTEERLAEILSIRDKPRNPYTSRAAAQQDSSRPEDALEYFVHWDLFNKRLDEWVSGSRLILSRDMEWPRPKTSAGKKGPTKASTPKVPANKSRSKPTNKLLKRATSNAALSKRGLSPSPSTPGSSQEFINPLKRKAPHDEVKEEDIESTPVSDVDAESEMDVDAEGELESSFEIDTPPDANSSAIPSIFSKQEEIEKLRTSGSMTQSVSEIARVKNLNKIQMGKHEVEAWYFSPYPKEYAHLPILYLCEFCLAFFPSFFMLKRHRTRCTLLHPPGNEIYRHEDISFFEIDGKRQLTYCRNLSLLSKCFLDHKTLYYDVTPFMYYIMCQRDSSGCHILGYFSKEKESAEGYNLACILTLPQYQRHGYGKLLIEFSYELSKKEGKLGSPEKPLSDLGLLGYRAYWSEAIVDMLLNSGSEGDVSIDEIAQKTSITHADIMNTCTTLQMFKHYKGQNMIVLTDALIKRHEAAMVKRKRRIHPENLRWKPPVFTRDQLRFGW